jgi:hypothetical protein
MIRIYHRAATELDLKGMARGRGSLVSNLFVATLPITAILFVFVYFLSRSMLASGAVAGAFFAASLYSNGRFFREVRRRNRLQTDPDAVEVLEVDASQVLDIEHLGSHGPAYCFFVDEGKALLLVGQWMLDQPSFPSQSFRLHRWVNTGEPIRIELARKPLTPEQVPMQLRTGYCNRDVEIFQATPRTLQQDMDRAFGRASFRSERNA